MPVREPYAARIGFYPSSPEELRRVIEECFLDSRWGPGRLPEPGRLRGVEPLGGVSPHAGYSSSGPCAATFYAWLGDTGFRPDTVVVVGTNHTGYGGVYTTATRWEEWETPLGSTPVDMEFLEELLQRAPMLDDDPLAHMEEHSVETQLPFLQYLYGPRGFRLVPIVAKEAPPRLSEGLAKAIAEVAGGLGRRAIVIASSDFTHHGVMYGYVVFTENVAENVEKLDRYVIEPILKLDTRGFLSRIAETGATVCGVGAIPVAMEYARLHGGEARLLKYYNSAQRTGEEEIAVGYAAIAFYRAAP
ncbi:MAG: AmmeMemoRadiSam system protein B [Crenarchaeota archaeon]|nr:AmmeMemoRadiSam system protein B [Thermoproteota archaeon]